MKRRRKAKRLTIAEVMAALKRSIPGMRLAMQEAKELERELKVKKRARR